ncbi:hypothetical protein [Streptomyces sp. SR-10]|uniref:hypothetical protein n=1 Tax=Streptomyces sp. SR-10 TaxID=3416442 RepID=UPI003CE9A627
MTAAEARGFSLREQRAYIPEESGQAAGALGISLCPAPEYEPGDEHPAVSYELGGYKEGLLQNFREAAAQAARAARAGRDLSSTP